MSIAREGNRSEGVKASIDPASVRFSMDSLRNVAWYGSVLATELREEAASRAAADGRMVVLTGDIQAVASKVLASLAGEFEAENPRAVEE